MHGIQPIRENLPAKKQPPNSFRKTMVMNQENDAVDFIKMLPDELIVQPDTIFDWLTHEELSRAGGVSHEWKHLANDELLWRRLLTIEEQTYFSKIREKIDISWKECVKEARSEYGMTKLMGKQFTGSKEYEELFGKEALVGVKVPALPQGIYGILNQPCPLTEDTEGDEKSRQKVKDTHLLFLQPQTLKGKGLSIVEWDRLLRGRKYSSKNRGGKLRSYDEDWKSEACARKTCMKTSWVLMPTTMMPGSTTKTWAEQKALMKARYPKYEISDGLSLVTGIMLHYLQIGERLYGKGYKVSPDRRWMPYARVTDTYSQPGARIVMGQFGAGGLCMSLWSDAFPGDLIGVAGFWSLS